MLGQEVFQNIQMPNYLILKCNNNYIFKYTNTAIILTFLTF